MMAGIEKSGIEKIREAESCTKDFYTRVSAPGVLENNKVVKIDMDEVYNIANKVQYLKEFFINALELPGTLTEYRLFGVKEEKEREIDENTTIDDIYQYVLTGSFIMKMAGIEKSGIEKIREAESCTKDFNTRVSAPGVLENNKVVIIDMDEVYNIGSKVQYLKEFFIDALGLPGTLTEYRLFGVEDEKELEIDDNTTIDAIYQYVLTGSFIMKFQKMPKQG